MTPKFLHDHKTERNKTSMKAEILAGCLGTRTNSCYFRPTKAKQKLGWVPGFTVQEICAEKVAHELAKAKQQAQLRQHVRKAV